MDKAKVLELIKVFAEGIPYNEGIYGIIRHPLISMNAVVIKGEFVRVTKENWNSLLEHVYKILADSDKIESIMWQIHSPFRLPILFYIQGFLTEQEFNETLRQSWIDTEFPHQNPKAQLKSMFDRANKQLLMDDNERDFLSRMPASIMVYRGINKGRLHCRWTIRGFSWTLSKEKANWFALRLADEGMLLTATIAKEHVYAYFNARNEQELVVNPKKLKIIASKIVKRVVK